LWRRTLDTKLVFNYLLIIAFMLSIFKVAQSFRLIVFMALLIAPLVGFSQTAVLADIKFNVANGSPLQHPGGLRVTMTADNPYIKRHNKATLGDGKAYEERMTFKTMIVVQNTGKDDVAIRKWLFQAICPENNMGLEWQENSSINLVTPYIDQILVLKPGEQKSFLAAETDFFWCLPKDVNSLKTSPRYFRAIIYCQLLGKPATANQKGKPGTTVPQPTPWQFDARLAQLFRDFATAVSKGKTAEATAKKNAILAIAKKSYPTKLTEITQFIAQEEAANKPSGIVAGVYRYANGEGDVTVTTSGDLLNIKMFRGEFKATKVSSKRYEDATNQVAFEPGKDKITQFRGANQYELVLYAPTNHKNTNPNIRQYTLNGDTYYATVARPKEVVGTYLYEGKKEPKAALTESESYFQRHQVPPTPIKWWGLETNYKGEIHKLTGPTGNYQYIVAVEYADGTFDRMQCTVDLANHKTYLLGERVLSW
jgi:hypothetical protein